MNSDAATPLAVMQTHADPLAETNDVPNVRMTSQELARLDTSITDFLNNYTVPSIHFSGSTTSSPPGNAVQYQDGSVDSEEIGGGLTAGGLMGSRSGNRTHGTGHGHGSITPYSGLKRDAAPLTPPTSSPGNNHPLFKKPLAASSQAPASSTAPNTSIVSQGEQLKRLYDERIGVMKRNEQERLKLQEEEWRGQMAKMKGDYEAKVRQLEAENQERRECEGRLREELERLEDKIERLHTFRGPDADKSTHAQRFKDDAHFDSNDAKCERVRTEYEQRIADLIAEFDREKKASHKILQSKVRSQLVLLIPKLKQKIEAHCNARCDAMVSRCRRQTEQSLQRLREEYAQERKLICKQAREDAEAEFRQWQAKARERMRIKLLQVKNEAERNVLERIKTSNKC